MKKIINLKIKKNINSLKRKSYSILFNSLGLLLVSLTLFFWQCKKDTFTGETTTLCPEVISTDPSNGALNVVLNKRITVTFNVLIDSLTLNATTFTLNQGNTLKALKSEASLVSGKIQYSGNSVIFIPSSLLVANTVYTGTITTGAKDTYNSSLPANYTFSFTTGLIADTVRPTVLLTSPVNGASNVFLNKHIIVNFSRAMDSLTLNSSTFLLKDGIIPVAGTFTYTDSSATFIPNAPYLTAGTIYDATITTGAKDVLGNALLSNYNWSFTTGAILDIVRPTVISTIPANSAINVARNVIISANFSEVMDSSLFTTSTFIVKNGAVVVPGVVTCSGDDAVFTPSSLLLSGTTYTVTIKKTVTDLATNQLVSDYVWSFSTIAPLGPISVDLLTVARFGIVSGVGVSNNAGFSVINNLDVGISPGVRSSIVGFPPATIVNGAMYASDDASPPGVAAMLTQAKLDLVAAYNYAEGATSPAPATVSGDLGGQTLAPGIYKSTSTLLIQSGDLTLDGQGDANAVWIFQIASAFTTVGGSPYPSPAGGNVKLIGSAQAKNVYWQVGSSATIGDYTSFKGNILALTSITMNAYARADGRMLARNGSVVMTSTNIINKP